VRFYDALLARLGVTLAVDLEGRADRQRVRVAGAKVATQTPPVKSGQRVIFTSLDDGTGVSDSAFFEAVHDRCAATVFHSWLLVIEGRLVRRGRRGLSVTAGRVWDLTALIAAWRAGRLEDALRDPTPTRQVVDTPRRLWHASGGSAGG
jgi:error-prone DNA polymerase